MRMTASYSLLHSSGVGVFSAMSAGSLFLCFQTSKKGIFISKVELFEKSLLIAAPLVLLHLFSESF